MLSGDLASRSGLPSCRGGLAREFSIGAFITHGDYSGVASNPSRVDAKGGEHFLQTDFSLLS